MSSRVSTRPLPAPPGRGRGGRIENVSRKFVCRTIARCSLGGSSRRTRNWSHTGRTAGRTPAAGHDLSRTCEDRASGPSGNANAVYDVATAGLNVGRTNLGLHMRAQALWSTNVKAANPWGMASSAVPAAQPTSATAAPRSSVSTTSGRSGSSYGTGSSRCIQADMRSMPQAHAGPCSSEARPRPVRNASHCGRSRCVWRVIWHGTRRGDPCGRPRVGSCVNSEREGTSPSP